MQPQLRHLAEAKCNSFPRCWGGREFVETLETWKRVKAGLTQPLLRSMDVALRKKRHSLPCGNDSNEFWIDGNELERPSDPVSPRPESSVGALLTPPSACDS